MVDKTPEEISLKSSSEQEETGSLLEQFGKRLRLIGSKRKDALAKSVSSGVKRQIETIKDLPKNLGKAMFSSLPPVFRAAVSGIGSLGKDLFSRDSVSSKSFESTPSESISERSSSKKYYEEFEWLSVIAENTEETNINVKSLLEFMRGEKLQEYEEKREDDIKHKQLITALQSDRSESGVQSISEDGTSSGGRTTVVPLGKGLLKGLMKPLVAIGSAFKLLLKPFALLGKFLPLLLKPLLILASPVLLKVAAVIAAAFTLFKVFSGDNLEKIVGSIKSAWEENILPAWNMLKDSFDILKDSKVGEFLSGVFDSVKLVVDKIKDAFSAFFSGIKNFFDNFTSAIAGMISGLISSLGIGISGALTGIAQMISGDLLGGLLTIGKSLLEGVLNLFDSLISNFLKVFGLDDFFQEDGSFLQFMTRILFELVDSITEKFTEIVYNVREFLSKFEPSAILESFSDTLDTVKSFFDSLRERFQSMIPNWAKRLLGIETGSSDTLSESLQQQSSDTMPITSTQVDPRRAEIENEINQLIEKRDSRFGFGAEGRRAEDQKEIDALRDELRQIEMQEETNERNRLSSLSTAIRLGQLDLSEISAEDLVAIRDQSQSVIDRNTDSSGVWGRGTLRDQETQRLYQVQQNRINEELQFRKSFGLLDGTSIEPISSEPPAIQSLSDLSEISTQDASVSDYPSRPQSIAELSSADLLQKKEMISGVISRHTNEDGTWKSGSSRDFREQEFYLRAQETVNRELERRENAQTSLIPPSTPPLSAFEPIGSTSSSALVSETSASLNLRDVNAMMEAQLQQGSAPSLQQQVNINNDSSSNVIVPQQSPNGRIESAQDVYGAPAY